MCSRLSQAPQASPDSSRFPQISPDSPRLSQASQASQTPPGSPRSPISPMLPQIPPGSPRLFQALLGSSRLPPRLLSNLVFCAVGCQLRTNREHYKIPAALAHLIKADKRQKLLTGSLLFFFLTEGFFPCKWLYFLFYFINKKK